MKRNTFKRTLAASLALLIVAGYAPVVPGSGMPSPAIVASAEPKFDGGADAENAVLISSNVENTRIWLSGGFYKLEDDLQSSQYLQTFSSSNVTIIIPEGKSPTIHGIYINNGSSLTITGGGTLNVKAKDSQLIMGDSDSSTLTIDGITLNLSREGSELGAIRYLKSVTINNATVNDNTGGRGIIDIKNVTIQGGSNVSSKIGNNNATVGDITIKSGSTFTGAVNGTGTIAISDSATVTGSVTATDTGTVSVTSSQVTGAVTATGTGTVSVTSSQVTGAVTQATGTPQIISSTVDGMEYDENGTLTNPTVTFNLNGANGSIDSQTISSGGKATAPTDPTRSGYTFKGWYTDAACTGTAFDFDTPITADTTLYAKWLQHITYINAAGTSATVTDYTPVTSETTSWSGTMVVADNVTIGADSTPIMVNGDTNLIICEGKTLTLNRRIHLRDNNNTPHTLTLNGTGSLVVSVNDASGCFSGNSCSLIINNCNVTLTQNDSDFCAINSTLDIKLNSGNLSASNPSGGISKAIESATITLNGGTLIASSYRIDATIIVGTGKYYMDTTTGTLYTPDTYTTHTEGDNYIGNIDGHTLVPVYAVLIDSGITHGTVTASPAAFAVSDYEAANKTVTLTVPPDTGYQLNTLTVTKASGGTVAVSGTGDTRTFTMPAENVTVSAEFGQIPVSYIDANGETKSCTEYTVLTGSETNTLAPGWYVVNDTLNYTNKLSFNSGDVNLILCDDAALNIGSSAASVNNYGLYVPGSLTVYGQGTGNGALNIYTSNTCIPSLDDFTQNGGNIKLVSTSEQGLRTNNGSVNINNGSLDITAGNVGIYSGNAVNINGGVIKIKADGDYSINCVSNVKLSWTKPSDSITLNKGINNVSQNKPFVIKGTNTLANLLNYMGNPIVPACSFTTNIGEPIGVALNSDGTVTPPETVSDSAVTFSGWYTDSGYTTQADFTQPISANTEFYGKYSVDYVDENGATQTADDIKLVTSSDGDIEWSAGTYVAAGNVTINGKVTATGNITLILCDGADFTINGGNDYGFFQLQDKGNLTIYGQTNGSGKLNVNSSADNCAAFQEDNTITVNGGIINAISANRSAISGKSIVLNKGTVTATGNTGIMVQHAGTLTFGGATVTASDYTPVNAVIKVKDGLTYTDGTGAAYYGTLTGEQIAAIAGKTLVPAYKVTFDVNYDGGEKIIKGVPASTGKVTAPTAPTRDGYTFDKWCSDPACTTAFDFDTAISADTTIYAKWRQNLSADNITDGNLTYNGAAQEPTVTVNSTQLTKGTDYTISYKQGGTVVSEPKNAGDYTVVVTGTGDYAGTAEKSFTIGKKSVTVSGVTAENKTYDGTTSAELDFTNVPSWKCGEDDVSLSGTGNFADKNVGDNKNVTITDLAITGAAKDNYEFASGGHQTDTTADIAPAPVTVKADNKSKTEGNSDPALTATVTGLVNGETVEYTLSRETGESVGTYTITPTGAAEQNNYSVTYQTGTFTINKYVAPVTKFTVTFNANGHGTAPTSQTVEKNKKITKPADLTADGYTFGGWFTDKDCATEYNFNNPVTSSFTLYAKWTENPAPVTEYTVTFDANGHGTAPTSQTVEENGKISKPADLTADGYTFGGWFTDKDCTTEYNFNSAVTSSFTLYAKWTENPAPVTEYTVTFNSNGGSGNMSPVKVEAGEYTLPDCTFTAPDGKKFAGWLVGDDTSPKSAGTKITVEADITLKAVWVDKKADEFTVKFDSNGGSPVAEQTVKSGETATKPANPTKDGYTFVKWQLDDVDYDFANPVMNDITLKAVWEEVKVEKFTITFNGNGGSGEMSPVELEAGEYILPDCTFTAPDGKKFAGWLVGDDTTPKAAGTKITVEADITLKAVWVDKKADEFTVKFDSNGGSPVAEQTVKSGETATKPANPTKDGFTFVKWQLDDVDYDFANPVTSDITLKAVWEEVKVEKFTVTNNLTKMTSSGAAEASNNADYTATFTADEGYVLPENVSVKIGENPAKDYALTNGSITISKAEITGDIVITGEAKKAPEVSSITLSKSTATLKPDGEISLKADVTMSDGSEYKGTPAVVWTSSDSAVATVDNAGNVKAIAAGTADITAKIGDLSAVCKVTVNAPDAVGVKSVTINKATGKITVENTVTLNAVVETSDNSEWSEPVTWTSDNTSVATVAASGNNSCVVTAKAAGTTTITAEAGGITDTYTITVIDYHKETTSSGTTVTFAYGDTYEYTGSAITPVVMVLNKDGKLLAEGTDYSVTYKNNKSAGNALAVVKGLNNYKTDIATTNLSFTITPADIGTDKADAPAIGFVFKSGKAQTAVPVLYFNGKKLSAGKDFIISAADDDVTVKNNKQISVTGTAEGQTYSITLEGKGNYGGQRTVDVVVHHSSAKMYKTSTLSVKVNPTKYVYDANGVKPTFTIKDKNKNTYTFVGVDCADPDVPFKVTLSNNAKVGKGTITITPTADNETYYGTKTVTFTITQKGQLKNYITVTNVKVKAKADGDAWTLEELLDAAQSGTLTGTIKISDEITLGEDFEVQYQKNTKKGTAKIIFIGINGYAGQKVTKTFKITQ